MKPAWTLREATLFCIRATAVKAIRYDTSISSLFEAALKMIILLVLVIQIQHQAAAPQVIGQMHGNQQ